MPKVSVIIPVYNVEKYLKQCIDSVINQTLKDIEIICIDDGSTDNCPQILDEYVKQDKRIKVIHKSNSGYGHSMNVGIDNATGEYIGIVESDDWILPDMYETLYSKAKGYDLDIIKSDYFEYWSRYEYKKLIHKDFLNTYYNKILTNSDINILWQFPIANWTGIYKREFLKYNNIRHNESDGASYQDTGFRVQVLSMAKAAMYISDSFYMYRQDNPASSVKSKQKMMCLLHEYEFVSDILQNKQLYDSLKICNAYRITGHFWNFNRIDDSLKKEYAKVIINDYKKLKNKIEWETLYNPNDIIECLEMLCKNPDEFYKNTLAFKANVENKLKQNIIIYGTGKVSIRVFHRLLDLNYDDNILFFVETNPKDNKFITFDVKKAEEIVKYKDDALVLVAVGKRTGAYNEVVANLETLGIKNYSDTRFLWE